MRHLCALVAVVVCFIQITPSRQQSCSGVARDKRQVCGVVGGEESRSACLKVRGCCYDSSSSPKCYINTNAKFDGLSLTQAKRKLGTPPNKNIDMKPLQKVARNLNVSLSDKNDFQGRLGMFSTVNTFTTLAFGFPKCPLNVPMCQRLLCQPFNPNAEKNANECYKDPRCCFDADLFVNKQIFGDNYLGNAPVCFLGPTSLRFMELARNIRPWSPFYLEPIVEVFGKYLDLNIDFQKARQCLGATIFGTSKYFQTPKCGWDGISKIECNLKGCCFNDKNGQCVYPRYLFKELQSFGIQQQITQDDRVQFPELFQSTTMSTTCSDPNINTSPLEVFQRLPCSSDTSSSSSSLATLLYSCPASCCRNYYAFLDIGRSSSSTSSKLALLTGGNSQFNIASALSGNRNPLTAQFFLNAYCPYFYFQLNGLPDLSESVKGCCKQTSCYHKSLGQQQQMAMWGQWGQWSQCTGGCNQPGQQLRTRACTIMGQVTQGSFCSGGSQAGTDRRNCVGQCVGPVFNWGVWSAYGNCIGQCDMEGYQLRSRTCQSPDGARGDSCPGNQEQRLTCTLAPCPCSWTAWSASGSCSRTCRPQGTQFYGRQTYTRECRREGTNAPCNSNSCPGSASKVEVCASNVCPSYQIGAWTPWGRCNRNCRQERMQMCTMNGRTAARNTCQGQKQTKQCQTGLCRPLRSWVSWSNWSSWTDCVHTGLSSKTRFRICLYLGRSDSEIGDDICEYVHQNTRAVESAGCPGGSGGSFNYAYNWSSWGSWSQCDAPVCRQGKRTRTKRCLNRNNGATVSSNNCPGNAFEQETCDGECNVNIFADIFG